MQRFQLAINTVSLRGSFLEILDACAAAGFKTVEFNIGQVKEYLGQGHSVEEARQQLDQRQLKCIGGFEVPIQASGPEAEREANYAHLAANAELLSQLGTPGEIQMVVGTNMPVAGDSDPLASYGRALAEVARRTAPFGVGLVLEFNWGGVKTIPGAFEMVRRSGAANAGIVFDPAHFHCTATKSEDLTPEVIGVINHVHVDNMRQKPAEFSDCNSDRVLPNDPAGVLDLKKLLDTIEAGGYKGYFSIEMFSDELWAMPAREAAGIMYQSLLPLCSD